MASVKERIRAAAARGRSGMSGIRPVALGALAGAAVGFIDNKLTTGGSYPATFTTYPWMKPGILAVGSFFLSKKSPALGAGLAGAAGMMAAQTYLNSASTTPQQQAAMGLGYQGDAGALPWGRGVRQGAGAWPVYAGQGG